MKSIGLQIKDSQSSVTVLELLREYIWGRRHVQFYESERKMLIKLYRSLERQEIKIEKTIYDIEFEIHKLEQDAILSRRGTGDYLRICF